MISERTITMDSALTLPSKEGWEIIKVYWESGSEPQSWVAG